MILNEFSKIIDYPINSLYDPFLIDFISRLIDIDIFEKDLKWRMEVLYG